MHPALTPAKLYELCENLKKEGALGCLISGGCLPNGSLPIKEFLSTIKKIKETLDMRIFVHTGIVDDVTSGGLKKAGVDAALIDVIGSKETIKEICNLNVSTKGYENSLKALHNARMVFVPHVVVGLHFGMLKGELTALEMISRYKPSALVIIAFMPIRGTEMESVKPPTSVDIARVVAAARVMFPKVPLVLGCIRPKGRHREETDVLAIKAGVDAIAFPSEKAVEYAKRIGLEAVFFQICCSQIYSDISV